MVSRKFIRTTTAMFALASLAACGGSGGGGVVVPTPTQLDLLSDENDRLTQALDAQLGAVALTADLPSGGFAYEGVLSVVLEDPNDGVIGELTLNGEFDNVLTFAGSVENFATLTGTETTGSLTIADGRILTATGADAGEALAQSGNVTGTILFDSGSRDIAGGMAGAFTVNDAALLAGAVNGTATSTTDPLDAQAISGSFVGELQ